MNTVEPAPKKAVIHLTGFMDFIREQGVVGLAVGFILGGSIAKVVSALVEDLINPILGILLGAAGNLSDATFSFGTTVIKWGHFLSVTIDFLVVASVVYAAVKIIGLDKLDKKKA